MWALRFKPLRSDEPTRLRLLMLSRNLTRDRSWDIAADPRWRGHQAAHKPSIGPWPTFSVASPIWRPQALPMAHATLPMNLPRTCGAPNGALPEPFQSVSFAVNGLGGKPWRPEPCARLGVISPFCDDKALSMLADLASAEKPIFIGRSDELALVPGTTLDRFQPRGGARRDGGHGRRRGSGRRRPCRACTPRRSSPRRGWDTAITVGSGNATRPALLSGSNVEIFATLTGKRSRVGSVEEILGRQGVRPAHTAFRAATSWPPPIRRSGPPRRGLDAGAPRALPQRPEAPLRARASRPTMAASLWRVWLDATRSRSPLTGHRRFARLAHHAGRRSCAGRA